MYRNKRQNFNRSVMIGVISMAAVVLFIAYFFLTQFTPKEKESSDSPSTSVENADSVDTKYLNTK